MRWTPLLMLLLAAGLAATGCDRAASPKDAARNSGHADSGAAADGGDTDSPPADLDTLPDLADTGDDAAKKEEPPWPARDKREKLFIDFDFTDQTGRDVNLKNLLDKPTVAAFIFTGCKNAQMCPMQATKIGLIQEQAKRDAIDGDVRFLIITFDPANDTPAKLKAYVEQQGVTFDNALALCPRPQQFRELVDALGLRVWQEASGELNHQVDLMLFDERGHRARWRAEWDTKTVYGELKTLVDEMRQARSSPIPQERIEPQRHEGTKE